MATLVMNKKTRFMRQFNRACAEFKICEGTTQFLVPVDADGPHLCLLCALQKRSDRSCQHLPTVPVRAVHLYSDNHPAPQTVSFLDKFCAEHNIPFSVQRVEPPSCRAHLSYIYQSVALALGTDRVAVKDSLDYIDATILSNMAFEGIFTGPSVCEQVQCIPDRPAITIVRPFCLLTDEEIQKTATGCGFPNAATGMRLVEEPFMEPARRALSHMLADGNVRLNFFNAQFKVEKKYVGCGTADGPTNE
jgi:hypothetical protein